LFYQSLSLIGALLILVAYGANQRGTLDRRHVSYNLLNLFGSACLAWVAIADRRAGFIILECAWALLSIPPLFTARRTRS
jgi:hypothetical protein